MDMDKEIKNEFDKLAMVVEAGFKEANKRTDMKIDNLALVVEAGFQKAEKRTDEKIDNLAAMVKRGFDETAKKDDVDKGFDRVDRRFEKFETEMRDGFKMVDERFDNVNARLDTLERDIAIIREHFVYKSEFEDLMGRVSYTERKLGIESGK